MADRTIGRMLREQDPPSGHLASPVPQHWDRASGRPHRVEGYRGAPGAVLVDHLGHPISIVNRLPVQIGTELRIDTIDIGDINIGVVEQGRRGSSAEPWAVVAADLSSPPAAGVKTVTSTAAEVFAGSIRRQGRSLLTIRNMDPALRVRVGPSGVTDETGFAIEPESVLQLSIDPSSDVPIYAVSERGNVHVEVLEA